MFTVLFFLVKSTRVTIRYIWFMLYGPTEENFNDEINHQFSKNSQRKKVRNNLVATDGSVIHFNSDDDDDDDNVFPNESMAELRLPVSKIASCYKMNHKFRGQCVIFNHSKYEDDIAPPREGTDIDVARINKTFTNLGFSVAEYKNLDLSKISATIEALRTENHEDKDCICIFVLTHGFNNDMLCANNTYYRTQSLWKPFTPGKCPSLAGKPKLFFIQACRGSKLDSGVQVRSVANTQIDGCSTNSYKIPTHADFLIAYSTQEGHRSWRSEEEGTWFVQSLCDVLDEYWETTDLLSMLTITWQKIATDYSSNHVVPYMQDRKQMPSLTSMLIRQLYFNPEITTSLLNELTDTLRKRIKNQPSRKKKHSLNM